jgi:hypothetical protein
MRAAIESGDILASYRLCDVEELGVYVFGTGRLMFVCQVIRGGFGPLEDPEM